MRKAKGGGASGSGNTPMTESDKSAQQIRALQTSESNNKTCMDCGQRGPTYVNMTIGSFVCTKCSGMLRGINPPHRIKSISMSSFSADEIDFLRSRGNLWCQLVWLGLYEGHRSPEGMDEERVKEFIIEKYEKKRYYVDPSTIASTLPQPNQSSLGGWTPNEATSGRSNLIGSTLTGRLASGGGHAQTSRANADPSTSSVVSRPTNSQPQPSESSLQSKPDSSFLADFSAFSSGPTPSPAPLVSTSNANQGVDPFGSLSKSQPNTGTPSNFNANSETNDFFADFDGAQFDTPTIGTANVSQAHPPKLPPRPIISRKTIKAIPPISSTHDGTNLQRYRVRFEPDQTLVEKAGPVQRKLAPKKTNPSLPNISVLAALREDIEDSESEDAPYSPPTQSLNPFSPNYNCKFVDPLVLAGTNPFRKPKNPYQLGEDFFASLFDTTVKMCVTEVPSTSATVTRIPVKCEPNPIVPTNKTNLVFTATPIPKPQASTSHNTPGSVSSSAFGAAPAWGATPPLRPLMQPKQQMVKQQATRPQSTPITNNQTAADKYAALKDLDEIFKSTVTLTDTSNLSKSLFEKESSTKGTGQSSLFDSTGNNDSWATSFNKLENTTSSNAGTTWDWADRNGAKPRANSAAGTTGVATSPVNPFTGAGNMSQLNTSPWPTTGTSPVNNPPASAAANWPPESASSNSNNSGTSASTGFESDPFATFNLQSGSKGNTMDFFGTGSQALDDPFATNKAPSAQVGNGNFDAFLQTLTSPGNGAMGNGNPWTSSNVVQNDLFSVNNPGIPNSSKNSTNPFL
ncbi:hypothetical protein TCAL_05509 [Tigriopus californicus]|uniref:Arf-GAP domain-containing protein n=1 Tax=Tigriopus californicus TaxID=6832 RepID=A0A553NPN1_TIGCA|nr:hypothetical protein TCAL_05509 [Tigriopus californicus]